MLTSQTHTLPVLMGMEKHPIHRDSLPADDVDKVLETASAIPTPTNKEKLHTIKKKFIIDENHHC